MKDMQTYRVAGFRFIVEGERPQVPNLDPFITDSEDFDEEKLRAAGVDNIFMNNEDLDKCIALVSEFIRNCS